MNKEKCSNLSPRSLDLDQSLKDKTDDDEHDIQAGFSKPQESTVVKDKDLDEYFSNFLHKEEIKIEGVKVCLK